MDSKIDISGLVAATNTRRALQEVEARNTFGELPSGDQPSGPKNLAPNRPIYDEKGNLMANSVINDKTYGLGAPENLDAGTLLTYDDKDGERHYSRVIKAVKGQKVVVKNLAPRDGERLAKSGKVAIHQLGGASVVEISEAREKLTGLRGFFDPSEGIAMKLISLFLMKTASDDDSTSDIFIQMYLRILVILVIIGVIAFVLVNFF